LHQLGHKVIDYPKDCEIAVVLGGRYENPCCLAGKKLLVWHDRDWGDYNEVFKPLVEEYYNKIIDVTHDSLDQAIEKIEVEIDKEREIDQPGSTD